MSDDDKTPSWKPRFMAKIDTNGPKQPHMKTRCHVWIAALNGSGYGRFYVERCTCRATHAAFFLKHRRWPKLCMLHKCDTPACVRSSHLFEGTKLANMRDMIKKGRAVHPCGESNHSKLKAHDVLRIRASSGTSRSLGREYSVSHRTIQDIKHRRKWSHL